MLKLSYSQYRELQAFAQFGSDLDNDTKERLAQGERIVEVLKQDRNSPISVELQVVIIFAVINDMLKDIEVSAIKDFEKDLFEYMTLQKEDILETIRTTGDLNDETKIALTAAINEFKEKFILKK